MCNNYWLIVGFMLSLTGCTIDQAQQLVYDSLRTNSKCINQLHCDTQRTQVDYQTYRAEREDLKD